jgi:hypothetical protein
LVNHERELRRLPVNLEDLCAALDDGSFEHQYFLDTETGDVIFVPEMYGDEDMQQQLADIDADETGRYVQVPSAESSGGYRDMEEYIAALPDERLQELLEVAIRGKGAFRRFKDVLARDPGALRHWFEFKSLQLQGRAREWLADQGYEPSGVRPPSR